MSKIDCAFPGDHEHDHEMCVDAVREREAIDTARNIGRDHGRNAASWFFDGTTDRATYEAVRRGLEGDDPEILDQLPTADLSGQWADGYTLTDLARDCGTDEDDEIVDVNAMVAAYEEGHMEGVRYEIERAIAYQLDGEE